MISYFAVNLTVLILGLAAIIPALIVPIIEWRAHAVAVFLYLSILVYVFGSSFTLMFAVFLLFLAGSVVGHASGARTLRGLSATVLFILAVLGILNSLAGFDKYGSSANIMTNFICNPLSYACLVWLFGWFSPNLFRKSAQDGRVGILFVVAPIVILVAAILVHYRNELPSAGEPGGSLLIDPINWLPEGHYTIGRIVFITQPFIYSIISGIITASLAYKNRIWSALAVLVATVSITTFMISSIPLLILTPLLATILGWLVGWNTQPRRLKVAGFFVLPLCLMFLNAAGALGYTMYGMFLERVS